jgi:Zn-dependent peptidase ImmA (M78 family)
MKNIQVDARTSKDIDERIDRIHRDIGYVDGHVLLPDVRELLRLDLHYYRTNDPRLLDEVVHKLKVGAKQVVLRPTLLIDAVKKFDLSALFVPDRKRILIDESVPDLKKRWCESHEVAHSVIPWHADYMLGDDRTTLSQDCHDQIEVEANYGAGRLLFPKNSFAHACRSSNLSIAFVRELAKHFGNTITSTLWRCIEGCDDVSFATIGEHPRHPKEGKPKIEYFIRSDSFEKQFSNVSEAEIWGLLQTYCAYKKTGPLGSSEIVLQDDNGEQQVFLIESFSNHYNTLSLARKLRASNLVVSVAAEVVRIPS